jgi:3'(2'), 5'-bisphosphate nucleotidase
VNRNDELEAMLRIAREASAIVARVYATDFAVDYKGPADPVTRADREANALICARLAEVFGPVPVVAEESDESEFAGWVGAPRVFFVDPLDGTLEFVAKNGDFVVMIGLAEEGRAVAGVVISPALGTAWVGGVGVGAFEVAPAGERTPIRVSNIDDLTSASLVVSRSHQSDRLKRVVDSLGITRVAAVGSAGLKAAHVASGKADVYLQPGRAGMRWDTCAPEAIVVAAGGAFTDAMGRPLGYGGPELANNDGFLATNGKLHARVLEQLRRAAEGG